MAKTYEEWRTAALADDERSGRAQWRRREASSRYDFETIRFRLDELRKIRRSGDPHRLLYYLHEGVHGNMGGMGSTALYGYARFGTKDLITDYVAELAEAIEQVPGLDESEVPFGEKLACLTRASHCFGRSALMLSGAGSLGAFHLGVARALHCEGLLPTVISGASAGAFAAAVLGTRTDDELSEFLFSDRVASLYLHGESREIGGRLRVDDVSAMIAALVPDVTFEEAYEHSGRKINISVSPSRVHQRSRLLNAVTSPNVYLREAVLASCAIPGVFPPVTLSARSVDGRRDPYIRSRTWVDGSVTDDQPAKRLARLYGVNHFISSQANPVVLWALRDTGWQESVRARILDIYRNATKEFFRATYPLAMNTMKNLYPLNVLTRFGYSMVTQDYTADVNILLDRWLWDPRKLLAVLSETETMSLIHAGERATWPKIELIRNCTRISRTLDAALRELEARRDAGPVRRSA